MDRMSRGDITFEVVNCILLGIVFFNEWPDWLGFVGLVLTLAALYVLNTGEEQV